MRRLLAVLVIAVATLPVPQASASVPVLVVDGRGFGHGVGMAQDGAYWMGAAGARTEAILGHFYPGTRLGRGQGAVRVVVGDRGPAPASLHLAFPSGGVLRDARPGHDAGLSVEMRPGEHARIVWGSGRYRVERFGAAVALGRTRLTSHRREQIPVPTSTSTTARPEPPTTSTTGSTTTTSEPLLPSSTTTTAPPESTTSTTTAGTEPPPPQGDRPSEQASSTRPIWAVPGEGGAVELAARQRRYRGLVEATAASGSLRAVNEVDVETYLKGMGEVRDPRWPAAALRAQAIAARTYALRAMAMGGEICDTQRCQVYLGAQAEYGAMNKAVDDTRGQVLVFGRQLASAVYSANGGGHSASREEGFGVAEDRSAPYLRAAPYLTRDPMPWNVTVALDDVAARAGYPGEITAVNASRTGPSGRVLEVTLDGSAGPKAIDGIEFDASLGLRSTLFALRVGTSDVAPPPPPPAEQLIQAPPEQAAVAPLAPATTSPRARLAPRVELSPDPASGGNGRAVAIVFASWAAFAAACAGAIALHGRTLART